MPGNSPGGGQTTKSLLIHRKVREFSYRSQHRLSLMQKNGLLDTFKSSFKLLKPEVLKQMVQ